MDELTERLRRFVRSRVASRHDAEDVIQEAYLRVLRYSAQHVVQSEERLLFSAVAISAGICEEIVFRGWLLSVLHNPLGFTGTTLVFVAAALFGLCHIYQGPTGVVGATAAGVLLTALYVATGTLLAPIVLHALIDIRMAVLPSSAPRVVRAQPA